MIRSLLPVVQDANNFPPHPHSPYPTQSPDGSERYVPLHLTLADYHAACPPLGLLRPHVVEELLAHRPLNVEGQLSELTEAADAGQEAKEAKIWQSFGIEGRVDCVYFDQAVLKKGPDGISAVMADMVNQWKRDGKFSKPLSGWRNELYQIYHPPTSTAPSVCPSRSSDAPVGGNMSNKAFNLERAACAIFGVATFGVHLHAYEGEGDEMKVWVPRRAKSKAAYPGLLDSTVGGGLTAGLTPLECVIKECGEEAGLPADFVRARVRCVGVMMDAGINPDGDHEFGANYLYDLPLPAATSLEYIKLTPFDGEVEAFELFDLDTIRELLFAGEFKPNSAAMMVDFLLRHGHLTPENEPKLLEIRWELSRHFGLSVPC